MAPPVMSPAVPRSVIDEVRSAGSGGDATLLRCGGCGERGVFRQGGRDYGRLVRGFLSDHELCRSAVEITRSITVAS